MGSEHDKNEGVSLEAVNVFQARWRALFTKWAALFMVSLNGQLDGTENQTSGQIWGYFEGKFN